MTKVIEKAEVTMKVQRTIRARLNEFKADNEYATLSIAIRKLLEHYENTKEK